MYNEYYGLTEHPFNVVPNPRYMFFSENHKQAFSELLYGVEQRKGFLLMTGEVGSGKSTLSRLLLNYLGDDVRAAMIINPNLSGMQLLATILEDYEVEPKTKTKKGYIDALNTFLLSVSRAGSTSVLIIDEAQSLGAKSLEQLRMLSNFETNEEKLLQIIMVGQPELETMLDRPSLLQLRQRVGVWTHLYPLDLDETHAYIRHRFEVAAGEGARMPFTDAALTRIFEHSQGSPRMVNVACDRALLLGYLAKSKEIGVDIVERAIARPTARRKLDSIEPVKSAKEKTRKPPADSIGNIARNIV
jgi:general secretion pathway protein A